LTAFTVPLVYAGVIHPSDKLTEDEKVSLVRDLMSEYANAKVAIPRSKKPLDYNADGTYDHMQWHDWALTQGQAARLGDKVQITKIGLDGDHLVLELNGGLKSGDHWYNHVQIGMGGVAPPVNNNGNNTPSMGTSISIDFHKPMENLTAAEVKRILTPILDFDKRTVTQLYSETLPPATQAAIREKRAMVGMDRDEVLLALGHPDHKYRETKDGVDQEDWIYGTPPGKVSFVTFAGNKVIKVKEEYAGLGMDTR